MSLFEASDIANLDGEFVDCGHVTLPLTYSINDEDEEVITKVYPDNYTTKTPMYFEKLDDKQTSSFCGMTTTKTQFPMSRPFAYQACAENKTIPYYGYCGIVEDSAGLKCPSHAPYCKFTTDSVGGYCKDTDP